jgi:hypothetical protein
VKFKVKPQLTTDEFRELLSVDYQLRMHNERVYAAYMKANFKKVKSCSGQERWERREPWDNTYPALLDFLALEDRTIKRRIQQHDRRGDVVRPKKDRPEVAELPPAFYAGQREAKRYRKKDRKPSMLMPELSRPVALEGGNRNAKTIPLFENEMIAVKDVEAKEHFMITVEDHEHATRTRPMMPRPANLGIGRGARPLPPGMKWKWDNDAGYVLIKK